MIKFINMAQLFKRKQKLILVIGMLSVTMLGCVSLTNGVSKTNNKTGSASKEIQELYKYKTLYVGDSSKVSNIVRRLAYSDLYQGISLKTDTKPYGVTVSYDFSKVNMDINSIEPTLKKNAAIMFSLIDNVDIVTFKIAGSSVQPEYEYKRVEVQKNFDRDLREYTKSLEVFSGFIDSFNFKVKVFPEKYTPLMPSLNPELEQRKSAYDVLKDKYLSPQKGLTLDKAKEAIIAKLKSTGEGTAFLSSNFLIDEITTQATWDNAGVQLYWLNSGDAIAIIKNGKCTAFTYGMPIFGVYLYDLNGDGTLEVCINAHIGSGIIDERIIVYDAVEDKVYTLSDRGKKDFYMHINNDRLLVDTVPNNKERTSVESTGMLVLENKELKIEPVTE